MSEGRVRIYEKGDEIIIGQTHHFSQVVGKSMLQALTGRGHFNATQRTLETGAWSTQFLENYLHDASTFDSMIEGNVPQTAP